MPAGRPSTYTPEIATAICERLAAGETLRAICRAEGMPPEGTVRGWVIDNAGPGFAERYTRARDIGQDVRADEVLEIADGFDGKETDRDRLRVDARKWYLSKLAPKRYGDRLALLDETPNVGNTVVIRYIDKAKSPER